MTVNAIADTPTTKTCTAPTALQSTTPAQSSGGGPFSITMLSSVRSRKMQRPMPIELQMNVIIRYMTAAVVVMGFGGLLIARFLFLVFVHMHGEHSNESHAREDHDGEVRTGHACKMANASGPRVGKPPDSTP